MQKKSAVGCLCNLGAMVNFSIGIFRLVVFKCKFEFGSWSCSPGREGADGYFHWNRGVRPVPARIRGSGICIALLGLFALV